MYRQITISLVCLFLWGFWGFFCILWLFVYCFIGMFLCRFLPPLTLIKVITNKFSTLVKGGQRNIDTLITSTEKRGLPDSCNT